MEAVGRPAAHQHGARKRVWEDLGERDGAGTGQAPVLPSRCVPPKTLLRDRQALASREARKPLPPGHRQDPGPPVSLGGTRGGTRKTQDLASPPAQAAEPASRGLMSAHPPGKARASLVSGIRQQQLETRAKSHCGLQGDNGHTGRASRSRGRGPRGTQESMGSGLGRGPTGLLVLPTRERERRRRW